MPARADTKTRVLLVGESWTTLSVHVKGFDTFTTSEYVEGATVLIGALRDHGHAVTYIPSHEVDARFPTTERELAEHDVVVLSDVGANTFLLTRETFVESRPQPNRLALLASFVVGGGGLLMVGGYMSFSGIEGRAGYGRSALAGVLPVHIADHDDRVETPEGVRPAAVDVSHPVVAELPTEWPLLLGYNRVRARAGARSLVHVGADPLLVVGEAGAGRTAAFTSDIAPHWAPPAFMSWEGYLPLFSGLLNWLCKQETRAESSAADVRASGA